jgi:hypothetical protein
MLTERSAYITFYAFVILCFFGIFLTLLAGTSATMGFQSPWNLYITEIGLALGIFGLVGAVVTSQTRLPNG